MHPIELREVDERGKVHLDGMFDLQEDLIGATGVPAEPGGPIIRTNHLPFFTQRPVSLKYTALRPPPV